MKKFSLLIVLCLSVTLASTQTKVIKGKSQGKKIEFNKTSTLVGSKALPDLVITGEKFTDQNGNNMIDADENCTIKFKVQNIGKGDARNVVVRAMLKDKEVTGLNFKSTYELGTIAPESSREITIPIKAVMEIENKVAEFRIEVIEERGLDAFPLEMKIETQQFQYPEIVVTDAIFSTEDGGTIKLNYPITLKLIVQNIGQGLGKNVTAKFIFPNPNCLVMDTNFFNIGNLKSGESKELNFEFTASRRYTFNEIPVNIDLNESYNKYSKDTVFSVNLTQNLQARKNVVVEGVKTEGQQIQIASLSAEVDKNIPPNPEKHPNRFAIIIGNEEYTKYQRGLGNEINVAYARNDATIFKDYVFNTLGVEEQNISFLTDATSSEIEQKIDLISKLATKTGPEAEIIFYYAGHGLPDENSKDPYLIPVDVNGTNLNFAIKLTDMYQKLVATGASRVTVFLDACFSGGSREAGLIAARGVKVKPKDETLSGNLVVFSASSGEQSALPYKDKQHGIFTYYLLKKLQESKGNISYADLSKYIQKNVSLESLRINQKEQDPQVNVSADIINTWSSWMMYAPPAPAPVLPPTENIETK
ncbi:MAG: caspase family protein [Lentimicrobiaceae bacterium]|nr:caspase family protein [Lentimicrobiaceae bacterium]